MGEFHLNFHHSVQTNSWIFGTLSGLRLWRTGMLIATKSKCHKSNVRTSWMYRYSFYDLKIHFWWPNKCLLSRISSLNTLYKKLTVSGCGVNLVSLPASFNWSNIVYGFEFIPLLIIYIMINTIFSFLNSFRSHSGCGCCRGGSWNYGGIFSQSATKKEKKILYN